MAAHRTCRHCRKAFAFTVKNCRECGRPLHVAGETSAETAARINAKIRESFTNKHVIDGCVLSTGKPSRFWEASRMRYRDPNGLDEKVPHAK